MQHDPNQDSVPEDAGDPERAGDSRGARDPEDAGAPEQAGPGQAGDPGHGGHAEHTGIDTTLRKWADAMERGDVDTLASLVTRDAEFWTQGAAPLEGRDALRAALDGLLASHRATQRFEEVERIVADGWVLLRGTEINVLEPRDGSPSREVRQRAFSVLRRGADGRWRFARGMTNRGADG